jgi:alkanesulfonate monooxygenase SsuD/methylene tetrahydromethanopterin reductase-like flavin-dependent oxidoreductase (luciferase family)
MRKEKERPMRLRILLEPHHGATYAQILALAKAAEEGGFDAFFRSDHYLGIDANDVTYQPTDSWTTLAGLARETERIHLGTLVNASTFRLPGQLAVEVATVDQMSGGRAELGIGAAWYEREHEYFGIPFPPLGERFDRLEEQLAILSGLWDTRPGERFTFDGKHYQLRDCASIPRWSSRPKLIIGGSARTWSAATRPRCGCPPPCPPASGGTPRTWSAARSPWGNRARACWPPGSPGTPTTWSG